MNKLLLAFALVGLALVVAGIGLVSIPAALIVAGVYLIACAALGAYARGSDR